ncbi:MAG: helix-turn-helix domain-containing protein, partial [Clostridia bacterium]|nr:helix-turn-helix domain-containing protein [Clostridia bacterium]
MKKRDYCEIAEDVIKAQNDDPEAMNRILSDVQDAVYYNCLRMLRDEHAAQDAAQDILITVYRKIGTLSDPQSYVGWVKRVTANHCKSLLCKVNREFLLSENEDGEDPFANF